MINEVVSTPEVDGAIYAAVGAIVSIVVFLLVLRAKNPDKRLIEAIKDLGRDYFT